MGDLVSALPGFLMFLKTVNMTPCILTVIFHLQQAGETGHTGKSPMSPRAAGQELQAPRLRVAPSHSTH